MIIGLVGKNSAGKGEVANYLKKVGYAYYSLSDMIREELTKSKTAITRDALIKKGRELRTDHGEGILADLVRKNFHRDQNYVVDSIRNPAEVRSLMQEDQFYLVCVDADAKIRFERMRSRGREGDPTTFADFEKLEAMESDTSSSAAQQVEQTEELASYSVNNDSSIEDLHETVRGLLQKLSKKNSRPGWDTYFMEIARSVASRSNCVKRKVAAVIVRDLRIISTGYNGTPRGVKNCNEGGCKRCNSFQPSGKGLSECLCSHAEENAIVQAAYHGMSVKGGTIYTTFSPCLNCTKMIINSGLVEVVYSAEYPMMDISSSLMKEAGINMRLMDGAA